MKRLYNFGILGILLVFFVFVTFFHPQCLFQKYLKIACPSCGLTRSWQALLTGNIGLSLQYNLLGIPLFLIFMYTIIRLCYDRVTNKITYLFHAHKFLKKYFVIIILIVLGNMVWNNIK